MASGSNCPLSMYDQGIFVKFFESIFLTCKKNIVKLPSLRFIIRIKWIQHCSKCMVKPCTNATFLIHQSETQRALKQDLYSKLVVLDSYCCHTNYCKLRGQNLHKFAGMVLHTSSLSTLRDWGNIMTEERPVSK